MDMATTNTTPAAAEYHARLQAIDPYSVSLAPGRGGVELIVFLLTVLDLIFQDDAIGLLELWP